MSEPVCAGPFVDVKDCPSCSIDYHRMVAESLQAKDREMFIQGYTFARLQDDPYSIDVRLDAEQAWERRTK